MERLDKLLSNTGRWSRKEIKELVRLGRITVNGNVQKDSAEKYSSSALICVDGEPLSLGSHLYLMMNKMAGFVSATEDRREKTVLDDLPKECRARGLFPVGRLDKDTEGFLLLTTDGVLAHNLLSPKRHVKKIYFAEVEGELTEKDSVAFRDGIILGDGTQCRSAELVILEEAGRCLVTVEEGKYHQVKRMLASRGAPVRYLKRLAMGGLFLDENLAPGEWRELTQAERAQLEQVSGTK